MTGAIPLLRKSLIDVRLGFALMRDRRVPLRSKALALLIGLALTCIAAVLELPIEGWLSLLVPVLGAAGDMVVDGAEMIAGPLFLAAALLPCLAPRAIVDRIRVERAAGGPNSPIIDI
ncbi:MAG: hypothetical protein ABSE62_07255 [Chthoniobacteraceae bacterium]|jgi:hypothetical protein